jgi:hypothetical protein
LTNIDVNLEDGDKAFYKLLENFKDALFYGKEDTITLDGVQSTLRTKELTKFRDMKVDDSGEGLNISRGRSESHGRGKGRSIGPSIGQRIVVQHKVQMLPLPHPRSLQERLHLEKGVVVVRRRRLL